MPFEQLLGNPRIKTVFRSYLKNQTIPFSMIFAGPPAAAVLDFAEAFAKGVNCLEAEGDFCGACQNCREISRGIYPDVVRLGPDGQFYKKEQITYLIEDNFKKPLRGRKKIYILADAHRLTENAANAFLKVLEEPAASSMFLLLTSNLTGLLPTIKSRCQILTFAVPSREEIHTFLMRGGTPGDKARLIAHLSQGSSLSLSGDSLGEFLDRRAHALAVLRKLLTRQDVEDVLLDLSHRSRSREKFLLYFRDLVQLISTLLRDIMVLEINEDSGHLIHIDIREDLMALGEYITLEKALSLIQRMEWNLRDVQRNLNTRVLVLEFIRHFTQRGEDDV